MNNIETIPLANLSFIAIPVVIVFIILVKWNLKTTHTLYAICRMLIQLLAIGYFLNAIFASSSAQISLSILTVMLLFASWIALDTVRGHRKQLFVNTFFCFKKVQYRYYEIFKNCVCCTFNFHSSCYRA